MFAAIVALLASAAMLGPQASTARPPLLDVTARVSAAPVAPGQRFQLVLDLVPAPGIHVYAPEVRNYRPIAISVRAQSGLTFTGAPRYPDPESYYYAPLKETVPVYQKPFRVVQEASLERSVQPGSTVTIAGLLSYQACDDRICYPPRTLPLTWTVRVMEAP
jgi:DsbC/DsbD-like thiol-disulfide interchange protein